MSQWISNKQSSCKSFCEVENFVSMVNHWFIIIIINVYKKEKPRRLLFLLVLSYEKYQKCANKIPHLIAHDDTFFVIISIKEGKEIMTDLILKFVTKKEDLLLLSKTYKEGNIKVNISKISRELNVDRKTIKKYLEGNIPKKTRKRKKYLTAFRKEIIELLKDETREYEYIDHLYRFMKRENEIKCNRVTFNRFIRGDEELNKLFKKNKANAFTVRFETAIGQQIQFDLKEKVQLITKNGEKY